MTSTNLSSPILDLSALSMASLFVSRNPTDDSFIWIAAVAMFVLVSIVVFHSLRDAKFVEGRGRAFVSILVALLGVVGLFHNESRKTPSQNLNSETEVSTTVSGLLIPYMALVLTIPAILILIMLTRAARVGRRVYTVLRTGCKWFGRLIAGKSRISRGRRSTTDDTLSSRANSVIRRSTPDNDA